MLVIVDLYVYNFREPVSYFDNNLACDCPQHKVLFYHFNLLQRVKPPRSTNQPLQGLFSTQSLLTLQIPLLRPTLTVGTLHGRLDIVVKGRNHKPLGIYNKLPSFLTHVSHPLNWSHVCQVCSGTASTLLFHGDSLCLRLQVQR